MTSLLAPALPAPALPAPALPAPALPAPAHRASPLLALLLATGLLLPASAGCPPTSDDDDDSAGDDDDDSTGDDDDSTGDDDDSAVESCFMDEALDATVAALADWERLTTCSNAFLMSATADQTVALQISMAVPEEVREGDEWVLLFDSSFEPKNEVSGSVQLQTGARLFNDACDDAIVPGEEPSIAEIFPAVEGSVELRVDEITGVDFKTTYTGTITMRGLHVELPDFDGRRCLLPDVTWSGVPLGWLPG